MDGANAADDKAREAWVKVTAIRQKLDQTHARGHSSELDDLLHLELAYKNYKQMAADAASAASRFIELTKAGDELRKSRR